MAVSRVKLVFDENFSHRHVSFVSHESSLGEIVHTRQVGWSGKQDKVWIPLAIGAGFIIVTGDRNERTRGYTVEDLKTMGARVILVGPFWDHMNAWDRAKWLVASIEDIHVIATGMGASTVNFITDRHCKVRGL
jgi:hypothetical protein